MEKNLKRVLACVLVVVMCVCGLPMGNVGTKASAVSNIPSDAVEFNGHYYKIIKSKASWKSAKQYCENLNGHLATISNEDENNFILDMMISSKVYPCWIGATDEIREGEFKWVTGEDFIYTNWDLGEPNGNKWPREDYIEILESGAWNDCENDTYANSNYNEGIKTKGYICEWETYAETYGWCLANSSYSFGYPNGYKIPWSRYFDLYGYNISSLITAPLKRIMPWNGNCFGLSLLSAANYYGIIDLSTYFSNSSEYLYDYGYEKIHTTNSNEQCFSVEGNEAIIETIENALISQDSVEFSKCEVFENDSDYSNLIEHFTNGTGNPIIVNMASGVSGHTMVLTNDFKPEDIGDGWYRLSAYDSNSPKNSNKLSNPTQEYERSDSYLLINPTTTEWRYYANDRSQFGTKYHSLSEFNLSSNLTGRSIWFYDVSLLDKSYFTSTLNLWYKKIQLNIFGSNIEVLDSTNDKTLLKITNGEIEYIDGGCEYKVRFNSDFENNITSGTFYIDDYTKLKVISDDSEMLAMSEKTFFSAQPNNAEIIFDFDEATITAICKDNSNDKIEIAAQDIENNYAVKAAGNAVNGETFSLSINSNEASIKADSKNLSVEKECENIAAENVKIIYNDDKDYNSSFCTCMCHKTGFSGFIYKIVRIFWKLFKINPTCDCGKVHY